MRIPFEVCQKIRFSAPKFKTFFFEFVNFNVHLLFYLGQILNASHSVTRINPPDEKVFVSALPNLSFFDFKSYLIIKASKSSHTNKQYPYTNIANNYTP